MCHNKFKHVNIYIILTLKHSNSEKGKVTITSRNERNVANLSIHPTESGFAVMKKNCIG